MLHLNFCDESFKQEKVIFVPPVRSNTVHCNTVQIKAQLISARVISVASIYYIRSEKGG